MPQSRPPLLPAGCPCHRRPTVPTSTLLAPPCSLPAVRTHHGRQEAQRATPYRLQRRQGRIQVRWLNVDERSLYTCSFPAAPACRQPACRPLLRRVGVHAGNYAEEILAADARGRPGFLLNKVRWLRLIEKSGCVCR